MLMKKEEDKGIYFPCDFRHQRYPKYDVDADEEDHKTDENSDSSCLVLRYLSGYIF